MSYQSVPGNDAKPVSWKMTLLPSSQDMMVYVYDGEANRYVPHEADGVNPPKGYPTKDIERIFEDIHQNTGRPPRVKRVLVGKLAFIQLLAQYRW